MTKYEDKINAIIKAFDNSKPLTDFEIGYVNGLKIAVDTYNAYSKLMNKETIPLSPDASELAATKECTQTAPVKSTCVGCGSC